MARAMVARWRARDGPSLRPAPGEPITGGSDLPPRQGDVDPDRLLSRVGGGGAGDGGDVIEERPVGFVSNGGDHRHPQQGDRPAEGLVAERPEIGQAAAAAGDQDHLDLIDGCEVGQSAGDLRRGVAILHRRMGEDGTASPTPASRGRRSGQPRRPSRGR